MPCVTARRWTPAQATESTRPLATAWSSNPRKAFDIRHDGERRGAVRAVLRGLAGVWIVILVVRRSQRDKPLSTSPTTHAKWRSSYVGPHWKTACRIT